MGGHKTFARQLGNGIPPKIFEAKISVSHRCNLRCRKCFHWKDQDEGLPTENLLKIIKNLAESGCESVHLVGGEPTLYPDLIDAIKYAKECGLKCSITTNGQLIDQKYARRLKELKLNKIFVSLDSHKKEIHDYIVGVNGAWEKTVGAIKKLVRYYPNKIKHITINNVITSVNFQDICDYICFVSALKVKEIKFQLYESTGSKYDTQFQLKKEEIVTLNNWLIDASVEISHKLGMSTNINRVRMFSRARLFDRDEKQQDIPCFLPFYRIEVNRKGNIYPCCMMRKDNYLMGNIFKNSIEEIVANYPFVKFKMGLIPPIRYPECHQCWDALEDNIEIMEMLRGLDVHELLTNALQ